MPEITPKHKVAILSILREAMAPVGSAAIARELEAQGIQLSSRTIRLYLQEMEKQGLVEQAGLGRSGGRSITFKGIEEIKDAMVASRLGYTAARVDTLAVQMTFNPATRSGLIVLNVSLVDDTSIVRAMDIMRSVFQAGLSMGEYLTLARAGEQLGRIQIPEGKIGIGTVCSVTLNGALLAARIPVTSRFGGVLEMEGGAPARFTDVINYDGTSLDPLEIFIKGRLLSVRDTARKGNGRIGVSFREVPTCVLDEVEKAIRRLEKMGLGGVLLMGRPNQPLLDFPVHNDRTGLIVAGGLNPVAALEEAGIPNINYAMATHYEFEKLQHYREISERVIRGDFSPRRPARRDVEAPPEDWIVD